LALISAGLVFFTTGEIVATITISIAILAFFGGYKNISYLLEPRPKLVAKLISNHIEDNGMDEPRSYFELKIKNEGNAIARLVRIDYSLTEDKKVIGTNEHITPYTLGDIPPDCNAPDTICSVPYEKSATLYVTISSSNCHWDYQFKVSRKQES